MQAFLAVFKEGILEKMILQKRARYVIIIKNELLTNKR